MTQKGLTLLMFSQTASFPGSIPIRLATRRNATYDKVSALQLVGLVLYEKKRHCYIR